MARVKALTLTQPWATLVARGAKTVETRWWRTAYRGPLAIHAAKGMAVDDAAVCFTEPFAAALGRGPEERWNPREQLPRGAVVAVAELVDVVPADELLWHGGDWRTPGPNWRHVLVLDGDERASVFVAERERPFGYYAPRRWAWLLDGVEAVDPPAPARGALGLWDWKEAPGGLLRGRPS
jgi:hypothetical protein